jgi:hypothetical protein
MIISVNLLCTDRLDTCSQCTVLRNLHIPYREPRACQSSLSSAHTSSNRRDDTAETSMLNGAAHLAFFSKPHRRFMVSATAVWFVGGCLQAGADSHEAARPLWAGTLAMVECPGKSAGSSQPVITVTLLKELPETTHLLEVLRRLAWTTDTAVWLPAEPPTHTDGHVG